MQKYDTFRNRYEAGKVLSQFYFPKKYPTIANIVSSPIGYIDDLEIDLNPSLPNHRIYTNIEHAGNVTSLFGSLEFYHSNVKVFSIPWMNGQGTINPGRFGVKNILATNVNVCVPNIMHYKPLVGTAFAVAPFEVICIATTAKFLIEENIPGAATSIIWSWAIFSSV